MLKNFIRKSKAWTIENTKLLTAVLALAAVLLNLFGRFTTAMWIFGALSGVLLLGIVGKWLLAVARKVFRRYSNRRYAAKEYQNLLQHFQRLKAMMSRDDTRAFRYMLYNASPNRIEAIDQLCACDYLEPWMNCFSDTLQTPCTSYKEFLARCREFTTILDQFDRNYVMRTQAAVEKSKEIHNSYVDNFETFREGFVEYLRAIERWSEGIRKEAQARLAQQEFLLGIPHFSFEKPKPFRKDKAVGA
jgi:hypothetical protein